MYLLVFVFLVISMMGLYAEAIGIQAAHFFASQTGIAQTMLTWHSAAYRTFTANWTSLAGSVPCQLAHGHAVGSACPTQIQTTTTPAASYFLPLGYNMAYSWSSYVYASGGRRFILTYMSPPSGGSTATPVVAADAVNAATGFSVGEVYAQIENMKIPLVSYGVVQGGLFVTRASIADQMQGGKFVPVTFPLPSSITVQEGSIGFISII